MYDIPIQEKIALFLFYDIPIQEKIISFIDYVSDSYNSIFRDDEKNQDIDPCPLPVERIQTVTCQKIGPIERSIYYFFGFELIGPIEPISHTIHDLIFGADDKYQDKCVYLID